MSLIELVSGPEDVVPKKRGRAARPGGPSGCKLSQPDLELLLSKCERGESPSRALCRLFEVPVIPPHQPYIHLPVELVEQIDAVRGSRTRVDAIVAKVRE